MGGFTVKLEGLKELDAKLTELGGDAARRVIRAGLRAGGEVLQAAVQERAPERPVLPSRTALPPGALKSDIELRAGKDEAGLPAVIVAPGKYTAHAAVWVEYGHRLVKGGYRRASGRGPGHEIGSVLAHPFIRPGYEAAASASAEAAVEAIRSGIEKEAAKK